MGTDSGYTCGKPSITYRLVESLCSTPETDVILCIDDISIKKGGEGSNQVDLLQISAKIRNLEIKDYQYLDVLM